MQLAFGRNYLQLFKCAFFNLPFTFQTKQTKCFKLNQVGRSKKRQQKLANLKENRQTDTHKRVRQTDRQIGKESDRWMDAF